ncbi:hypothetical protein D3C80_1688660 [compost metagenome]
MLEQGLPGRRQFVALGMLNEQRGAQTLLDIVDMPGHGAVGGVEAFGRGQQPAAALQLEKKPQIIPVEHAFPCESGVHGRCVKTHST